MDVEDQRSVLDLLRSVPTEEVEHDRIGARPLEAVVLDDPTAEHARVVLDGGDDGESAIEPPALEPLRPARVVGEHSAEPLLLQSLGVRRGVDPLLGQVLEDNGVGPGVPALLLDEGLDPLLQLLVVDQGSGLVDDVDEPPFTCRQQQMQHVDHVRGERIVRHPVPLGAGPVEAHHAAHDRVSLGDGLALGGDDGALYGHTDHLASATAG